MYECTQQDFEKFYPVTRSQRKFSIGLQEALTMYCLDSSQLRVRGDEFSASAISPTIQLKFAEEYCRNDPEDSACVTSKENEELLKDAYIMLWSNRKRFDQLEYTNDSPVVKESFI